MYLSGPPVFLFRPASLFLPASVPPAPSNLLSYSSKKEMIKNEEEWGPRTKNHINQEAVTPFCAPNVRHFSPGRVTSAVLSPCWQVSIDEKEGQRRCQRVPPPVPLKRDERRWHEISIVSRCLRRKNPKRKSMCLESRVVELTNKSLTARAGKS